MLPSDLVNYKKKSRKIIALTAWDSISGSIAEQANVDEGAEPEIQKVISRLIRMGIPVMGHIGLTPQSYLNIGLRKQGESLASQEKIKKEASILEELGCFSIVLEHIPDLLAKEIQNSLTIPTIGIGAGNYCDGQVRVTADLLGLNDDQPPFCQPIIQGKKLFKDKLKEWVDSERLS